MTNKLTQIIFIAFIICLSANIFAKDSEIISAIIPDKTVGSYHNSTSSFAPFNFTIAKKDPLCYNSSDGMAWVSSITGGTPPFTYEWLNTGGIPIPGETNDTITGLPAGNYFCRITDNDGTRRTQPFKLIDPPIILYDDVTVDHVSCNGADDGAITIDAVGGTGTLEYSIDNGINFQTGSIFTDLGPGNYNIITKDENNCIRPYDFNPVTINEPGAIFITLDDYNNLTCYGSGDGSIEITATGGTLPYTFEWIGPGSFTSSDEDLINLPAGSYNLNLTDANYCSANLGPVILTQPDELVLLIDNIQQISCYGADDGAISVTITGGTPPYFYSWTGPGTYTSNNEDISGLSPGDYNLQVTDDHGCIINSGPITITEPPLLAVTLDNIKHVSCSGGNDGAIYVTITGGTMPRVISWTGPSGFTSSTEDIINLAAGNYNLLVTDANGCTAALGPLSVTEPSPITIVTDSTRNVSCFGGNDGSIYISVSGGTLPYDFSWTGPGLFSSPDEDIINLTAGNYTLAITDANSCLETHGPISISQPTWLSVSIDYINHISCFGADDGSIGISASGGTPPYFYSWTGPGSFSSTDEDINNLSPGVYNLIVTDFNGCSIDLGPLNINEPPALTVITDNITNLSCFGTDDGAISVTVSGGTTPYGYSWTGPGTFTSSNEDINGLEPGNYNLIVTDAHSCTFNLGPITISEPAEIIITTDLITDVTCNGGNDGAISVSVTGGIAPLNYSWTGPGSFTSSYEDISNLFAGNYNLSVTDTTACSSGIGPIPIVEPSALNASLDSITNVSCNGFNDGSIYITVTGGVMPYTYSWTGPDPYTDEDITGLKPGLYSLEITDANSCKLNFGPVTITEPALLTVIADSVTDISCFGSSDGAVYVTVAGGTLPYIYAWTGPSGFNSGDEDITGLDKGDYILNITDENGCLASLPAQTVQEPDSISVVVDPTSILSLHCFGDANGQIDITVSGGTGAYSYSWTGPGGLTFMTEDISGLPAGDYNLIISDINSCSKSYNPLAIVTEPGELKISLSKTDITCFNDKDGTVTVSASGGTRPFEYSRNGITYGPDSIFTNLNPINYTIYVRDNNGCITSDTITIHQPPELRIISDSRDDSQNLCFGDSNAVISITALGGNPPLEYSIDSTYTWSPNNIFNDLPAGIYYVFVQDQKGCIEKGSELLVGHPAEIEISSYIQVDITSCYDNPEGQIAIEADGGVAPLTYTIDGGSANQTGLFSNINAGFHLMEITDNNGCTKDTSVFINSPPEIVIDSVYLEHITNCYGDNTGVIDLAASGGTGDLEFSIDGGIFGTTDIFINLPGGSHTITVRDDNNCEVDTTLFLNQPDSIGTLSEIVVPVTCSGDNDGSIEVVGSGGTAPYSYTLNPGPVSNSTGIFTGLSAGSYTVTVDDANGCPSYKTPALIVVEPLALIVDSTESINISCWGMSDGRISIYASGGFAPYQYSIDNGMTFDSLSTHSGLPPSVYYTFIKDTAGCLTPGDTIVLSQPPEIIINTESVTDIFTCFGDSTGSVNVSASGGSGSLQYSIDGFTWQDSGTFLDLPGGDYQVSVMDTIGCSVKSNILTVNQPDEIIAVITVVNSFNGEPGSIHISASGGTGTLEYSINGSAGPYQPDTAFTGLWPGDHYIAVRDANGCLYEETVTLEAIPPLEIDVSYNSILCHGDLTGSINLVSVNGTGVVEYSIDDSSTFQTDGIYENLPAGQYIIFVRDEDKRIFKDTVKIIQPDTILITADITRATCNRNTYDGSIDLSVSGGTPGYIFLWSTDSVTEDLTDLEAGFYSVTITDAYNCIYQDIYEVPANTTITANAGMDTTVCINEQVILNGSGGINYFWQPEMRLSNPAIPNPIATVSEEITYTLTVTEPGGCYDRDTVTLGVHPVLGIDAGMDTTIAKGQTIQLIATGGPFDEYSWMPQTGLDNPSSQSTLLLVSEDRTYYVTGTTSNGCLETDSIIITTAGNLIIYSGFTPNGDGINDFWDIDNVIYYPNITVDVYNRWGGQVFHSKGYSDAQRWDGKYKGKDVSIGTYWYVINLNDGSRPITGHITIVR
jgi:gliding motility-associated-like protein